MHRRTNPWPAFVDLFSALLIAVFAGFILVTQIVQKKNQVLIDKTDSAKTPQVSIHKDVLQEKKDTTQNISKLPGNCIDPEFLADIYYTLDSSLQIMILTSQVLTINSRRTIHPGDSYHLTFEEFEVFGHDVLDYCDNHRPKCRFTVKYHDDDFMTKIQYKNLQKLLQTFFYPKLIE